MRDSKNFEKIKVPFSRSEAESIKNNKGRYSKPTPFKRLGITCIGNECCDEGMNYDALKDKCVLEENFGNYFESMNNLNVRTNDINVIGPQNFYEEDCTFKFLNGNSNIIETDLKESFVNKRSAESLVIESLKKSGENDFNSS